MKVYSHVNAKLKPKFKPSYPRFVEALINFYEKHFFLIIR